MVSSLIEIELTQEAFRQWLESLPIDKVFDGGSSLRCETCPLAEYMGPGVQVFLDDWSYSHEYTYHPLPDWARRFISKFDAANSDTAVAAVAAMEGI